MVFRQLARVANYGYAHGRRGLASLANFSPGSTLHGHTVQKTKEVPELELSAVLLQHNATGAQHLHIAREDDNNVFAIGFKTNPPDATGVPHILEHTTLCGSEKYKVRDPFFKMLNRSLANYMNAMTASNFTVYPFATTNRVDYENLRDVYLDATLHPLLRRLDFNQEGWRLEHTDPRDAESPLTFKGVVYNEMKGQMSDMSHLSYIRFRESIYESLHNSGGDPAKITDLTYEQLRHFHAQHYHPSNAKVFTYGNFPLEEHLAHMDARFSEFQRREVDAEVKYPIELTETKRVVQLGPANLYAGATEGKYRTSVTWFVGPTTDVYEGFVLQVLTTLLTDGHASPLYQALIESNLGSEFSSNTGLDMNAPIGIYSVGVNGVDEANVEVVERTIREVLRTTFEDGLDMQRVEAILHQSELGRKHKSAEFGMNVLYHVTAGWFNQVDPLSMLEYNSVLARFREDLKKPRFLEGYIERYLLDDKPSYVYTMAPSEKYEEEVIAEEENRLRTKVSLLTPQERAHLYDEGLQLLKEQEQTEDLSSLPSLQVEDIPVATKSVALEQGYITAAGQDTKVPVQWHPAATNGLTYVRVLLPMDDLPGELHPYLPLFTEALASLGTATRTMASLENEIQLKTGGISRVCSVTNEPGALDQGHLNLIIEGYSLDQDVEILLDLMRVLATETNFDNSEKLRTLILGMSRGAVEVIASAGESYALMAASAAAGLKAGSCVNETLFGMKQVSFMTALDEQGAAGVALASKKLREIAQHVVHSAGMRVAMTCGQEAMAANEAALERFVAALPRGSTEAAAELTKTEVQQRLTKRFYELAFQVSYCGVCVRGVPYTDPDGAALQILANLLTHRHLHGEIREKGGAYGAGAMYNAVGGVFGFYSARDPDPVNSLQVIAGAGAHAATREWTDREIAEAKLSVFRDVDAPVSVDREGGMKFVHGITEEMRQARRSALLAVDAAAVRRVAATYLVEARQRGVAVLGPAAARTGVVEDAATWEVQSWL
ncbi:peptidase M16C associated-domain-containing protein [Limtongia smithiae]|uniref:peptidase M16C associated-domain-containing protein n=1 Tax=Limtongia smithiae TaxID=1125753 RepID=UPI0034CD37A2